MLVSTRSTFLVRRAVGSGVLVPRRHYTISTDEDSPIKITNENADFGKIAILSFNRPKAKHSISKGLLDELHTYIKSLATKDPALAEVRALILTSTTSDAFCAGADLKERRTFTQHDTDSFLHKLNGTLTMIEELHIPTISAIDGIALGGGLEVALSTDFRVLGSNALVGLPETRLAIVPGAGGTVRLPRVIGYSRALDLILTGRRVEPAEALQLGLANRVATTGALDEAITFARTICAGGPLAILAAKSAVRGASPEWEKVAYKDVVRSKDKFEALDAFANKRKPVFKGE
ncbi:Ehd3p [Sugiyamaella lignohabitans]|uniref:Ehd3p n=1 Tax=Sugiyamaella lignohabitans TaxID=796027 RepID=A0A167FT69_9ASCO|nr:Ehd3p [Sugiyamaella lignohabitans]ANB15673.1 Ehd3p [Sugiyamaella lignohabitans]